MKKTIATIALMATAACADNATTKESEATRQLADAAATEVGMPAITNFYEKRLLKEIYERRDQANLGTFAYVQGLDGRLTCLGQAIGYGVPYSTQYSNPMSWGSNRPQAEPNALFTPEGMSATWLQLVAPNGDIQVVYVEPTIVVSPFRLSGPAVAANCPE
jgi:hypothetical protein